MKNQKINQKTIEALLAKFTPVAAANPAKGLPVGKHTGGNYPMDSDKRFSARVVRREAEKAAKRAAEQEAAMKAAAEAEATQPTEALTALA